MSWDESNFIERLVPALQHPRNSHTDNCPGDEVLCSLVDNELDAATKDRILGHIRECPACAHLTSQLQAFGQEGLDEDPDWENTGKRLDLWMESFLAAQTAVVPDPGITAPADSSWKRRLGRGGRIGIWLSATALAAAGAAAAIALGAWPGSWGRQVSQPAAETERLASASPAAAPSALPIEISRPAAPIPGPTPATAGTGSSSSGDQAGLQGHREPSASASGTSEIERLQAAAAAGSGGTTAGKGLAASALNRPANHAEPEYLVEAAAGAWQVREHGQATRPLGTDFDLLSAGSEIRCVRAPCTLTYSTQSTPQPLFVKPPALNSWTRVPTSANPIAVPTATDLDPLVESASVRAAAQKDSTTCGGSLRLLAPRCHETLDTLDVKLQWAATADDQDKTYSLVIGATDASGRRRWNGIKAGDGAFQSQAVQDYLASLQRPDRPVDVTLRLMRAENFDAVRLVRLQSTADEAVHRTALRRFDSVSELPRLLGSLEEFLKLGMWSRAADVSHSLLQAAPNSLEVDKYALVGLCASDFSDDIARLRRTLHDAGIAGVCEAQGAGR
jgi:hypothetical protein